MKSANLDINGKIVKIRVTVGFLTTHVSSDLDIS